MDKEDRGHCPALVIQTQFGLEFPEEHIAALGIWVLRTEAELHAGLPCQILKEKWSRNSEGDL